MANCGARFFHVALSVPFPTAVRCKHSDRLICKSHDLIQRATSDQRRFTGEIDQ
jgi:hypothetical protein